MTDHPMQPSPEQLAEWLAEAHRSHWSDRPGYIAAHVACLAYAAGADAELEACCEWLEKGHYGFSITASASDLISSLRAARRPKPPSLKQRVLSILPDCPGGIAMKYTLHPDDIALIRRAIEALPEEHQP